MPPTCNDAGAAPAAAGAPAEAGAAAAARGVSRASRPLLRRRKLAGCTAAGAPAAAAAAPAASPAADTATATTAANATASAAGTAAEEAVVHAHLRWSSRGGKQRRLRAGERWARRGCASAGRPASGSTCACLEERYGAAGLREEGSGCGRDKGTFGGRFEINTRVLFFSRGGRLRTALLFLAALPPGRLLLRPFTVPPLGEERALYFLAARPAAWPSFAVCPRAHAARDAAPGPRPR